MPHIVKVHSIQKDHKEFLRFAYDDNSQHDYPIIANGNSGRIINKKDKDDKDCKTYCLIENQEQVNKRLKAGNFAFCIFLIKIDFNHKKFEVVIDFSYAIFTQVAHFKSITFAQAVNFSFARFTQDADFSLARFTQTSNFRSATFTQDADFSYAIFTEDVDFNSATFTQVAHFKSITFTQAVDFSFARFIQASNFSSATFAQVVYFFSATFTKDADFSLARFTQASNFISATFTQDANFSSATFTKDADFSFATFTQDVNFDSATFTQNTVFGFTIFTKALIFTKVETIKLSLQNATVKTVVYANCEFQSDNRETFLVLKNVALKQNDQIRALEFHTHEHQKYLENLKWKKNFSDKFILYFECLTSNFGTSVKRSLFSLLGLIAIFYLAINGFNLDAKSLVNFILPSSYSIDTVFSCGVDWWDRWLFLLYKILQLVLIYEIIKSFRKFSRRL